MIQGCTNQIKAPEFTHVWESKGEMVQRCHGPLFLSLTLQWASQPKGDCKVYYHSAELLHLPNSTALSKERFTAFSFSFSAIWGEKWSERREMRGKHRFYLYNNSGPFRYQVPERERGGRWNGSFIRNNIHFNWGWHNNYFHYWINLLIVEP